jgi:hypothetical protein
VRVGEWEKAEVLRDGSRLVVLLREGDRWVRVVKWRSEAVEPEHASIEEAKASGEAYLAAENEKTVKALREALGRAPGEPSGNVVRLEQRLVTPTGDMVRVQQRLVAQVGEMRRLEQRTVARVLLDYRQTHGVWPETLWVLVGSESLSVVDSKERAREVYEGMTGLRILNALDIPPDLDEALVRSLAEAGDE